MLPNPKKLHRYSWILLLTCICQANLTGQAFVTTWKTDNPGTSADDQIAIPTTGGGYDYTVDWGDGNIYINVTGDTMHTYAVADTYTVSITGDFPRIFFNGGGDGDKLLTVEDWGNIQWTSMQGAFSGCGNLDVETTTPPDLSLVTDMTDMFRNCSSLGMNGINSLGSWNVSSVTDMTGMFWIASNFNQDIGSWNVGNVTSMSELFYAASAFNQDIGNWNVSSVTNMAGMFWSASAFDQDIGGWTTSSLQGVSNMFRDATAFNQDISGWDMSNAGGAVYMFLNAVSFDQNLGAWDVSNMTDMTGMFSGDSLSTYNYDATLTGWSQLPFLQPGVPFDAGNSRVCIAADARDSLVFNEGWVITDGGPDCTGAFITTWKTDNPGTTADDQVKVSVNTNYAQNYFVNWGDGTVTANATGDIVHTYAVPGIYTITITGNFLGLHMYLGGSKDPLKLLTVEQWGNILWNHPVFAFQGCENLVINASDAPDLSSIAGSMTNMFAGCTSLTGDFSNWDMSHATLINGMFQGCSSFNSDITGWDVSNVQYMVSLFRNATAFNQSIGSWDVSAVVSMDAMFQGATSFDQNIGGWDVSSVSNLSDMFDGTGLSTEAYDQLLNGWGGLPSLVPNVSFDAGNSTYCDGRYARDSLIANWNWTIIDAGLSTPCRFTTVWKTDNPGASADDQVTIPTVGGGYNYIIQWGDGSVDSSVTGSITHTYQAPGTYTVLIHGDFPRIYFNNGGDRLKLLSVEDWGSGAWSSMENAFYGCENLNIGASPTSPPDLSGLTSLDSIFAGCSALNADLGHWDISGVTEISGMLNGVSLISENYDSLLIGWSALPSLPAGITFDAGSSVFCHGESARDSLIMNWGWTMLDGGSDCTNLGPFIMTWKTDNPGSSGPLGATIQTIGGGYDYTIDWGDGSSDINVTGNITHYYAVPGTYTISISGDFPRFYFNGYGDKLKILSIVQWGNLHWTSMQHSFYGCENLVINAPDAPDLSGCATTEEMFFNCYALTGDLSGWDVSNVTNMSQMFRKATAFNSEISGWDVSNVTNMSQMFREATAFNSEISGWDVSNVTNMSQMFREATAFNSEISGWDMSNVTDMYKMFQSAPNFNQDVGTWAVGSVTNMQDMFRNCIAFDQDLGGWDISSVTNLDGLIFNTAMSTVNYDRTLIGWDTLPSLPQNLYAGFFGLTYCLADSARNRLINDHGWIMNDAGQNCSSFFTSTWNTTHAGTSGSDQVMIPTVGGGYDFVISWGDGEIDFGVTGDMTHTYALPGVYEIRIAGDFPQIYFNDGGDRLKLLTINSWGTIPWASMQGAFKGCANLDTIPSASPNLSVATNLSETFSGCSSLIGYGEICFGPGSCFAVALLDNWNVSTITDMSGMFEGCSSLDVNLSSWNISNVADMNSMFAGAGVSSSNYDNMLISWGVLPSLQPGLTFDAGNSTYCNGIQARDSLLINWGWTILDGGQDCSDAFITTWKTDNPGYSGSDQIIAGNSGTCYYHVNWGDGSIETDVCGQLNHTYAVPGTYTVTVTGSFEYLNLNVSGYGADQEKLLSVENWGATQWQTLRFAGCSNLQINAMDAPDLSNLYNGDASEMFDGCAMMNSDLSGWDMSGITNMHRMFREAAAFNQNIGSWDVSNVNDMTEMFKGASAFNQDIGSWDMSNVTSLRMMFEGSTAFDQNIGDWNVSNVSDFDFMFFNAGLSQPNYDSLLIGWSSLDSLQQFMNFHAGNSQYCAGDSARQFIIDTYNWGIIDDGLAPSCCPVTTTFTAGAWTNGPPSESVRAIIDDNYNTSIHGDIYACAVQINPATTLTVQAGNFVITINQIEVMGTLDIQTYGIVFSGY